MKEYLQFLGIGLVLGLFLEAELKLIAEVKPRGFIVALLAYPVLVTLFYASSRMIDRLIASTWRGDVLQYLLAGFGGLAFEWVLLGNGPGSNAFQLGMFAMWTTWGFGPRILTHDSPLEDKGHLWFWTAFAVVAILLTVTILMLPDPKTKLVIAVSVLSVTYLAWSVWLLLLGWRNHQRGVSMA